MPKELLQSMLTGHQGIGTSAPKTHTDPSTSKTVDTPLRRPSRAAPDAGQNLSRAAIEALARQNITGTAGAAAYLEAGRLAPPGRSRICQQLCWGSLPNVDDAGDQS